MGERLGEFTILLSRWEQVTKQDLSDGHSHPVNKVTTTLTHSHCNSHSLPLSLPPPSTRSPPRTSCHRWAPCVAAQSQVATVRFK